MSDPKFFNPNAVMTPPEMHNGALRTPVKTSHLGTSVLDKSGEFDAGSYQSFTLTHTVGRFGVDDSGSIRVVFRFATDQTNPREISARGTGRCKSKWSKGS